MSRQDRYRERLDPTNGTPAHAYGDALPLSGRARFQLFALVAGAATVAALVADAVAGARRHDTRIELEIGINNGLAAPQDARPEEAAPRLEQTANGTPVPGPAAAAAAGSDPAQVAPVPLGAPAPALPAVLRYPGPSTSLVLRHNGGHAQNGVPADAAQTYGWPVFRKIDGWAVDTTAQAEPVQLQAAPATAPPVEPPPPGPDPRPQLPPPPQPPRAAPATTGAGGSGPGLKTTKRILVLALLAGIAVYAGGGGVFGSFSAETTNAGSTASSGTLTMSDTVNTGTACTSISGTKNVNSACNAILTMSNLAPGVFPTTGTATVTVQDTGSIDASKLWLWAPPNSTTLSTALTTSGATTTLAVSKLDSNVASGQSIVVSSGGNSQTFVASAAATASSSATSIAVTSQTASFAYPVGAAVNVVDCRDAQTTTSTVSGATVGTDLNFNPTSGNPFCGAALVYVQEITGTVSGTPGTHNYCWVGATYSSGFSGACKAPINVALSSGLSTSGAITSLPVSALNGNVASGDSIVVTSSSGSYTQTFTAAANAFIGATSITISSATPNFAYTTSATVTDTTTLGSLNSDTTDTLTNFDTLHNGSQGPIELKTVTANGTLQSSGVVDELPTGSSAARKFQIGVYFPQPAGTNQNALQGLASTFGMTWHIDQ